jgi:hypothetical protein
VNLIVPRGATNATGDVGLRSKVDVEDVGFEIVRPAVAVRVEAPALAGLDDVVQIARHRAGEENNREGDSGIDSGRELGEEAGSFGKQKKEPREQKEHAASVERVESESRGG